MHCAVQLSTEHRAPRTEHRAPSTDVLTHHAPTHRRTTHHAPSTDVPPCRAPTCRRADVPTCRCTEHRPALSHCSAVLARDAAMPRCRDARYASIHALDALVRAAALAALHARSLLLRVGRPRCSPAPPAPP